MNLSLKPDGPGSGEVGVAPSATLPYDARLHHAQLIVVFPDRLNARDYGLGTLDYIRDSQL